jgi:hypothetical protein
VERPDLRVCCDMLLSPRCCFVRCGAGVDDVHAALARSARIVDAGVSLVGEDLRVVKAMPASVVLDSIA